MPGLKHTHTYVQYKKLPGYWRCAAKGCTHYIDKERMLGRLTRCNSCGAEFELSEEDLRRVKPKCIDCANTKEAKMQRKVREIESIVNQIHATTQAKAQVVQGLDEPVYNDEEDRF